ncbi:MAG: hypothetical protein ACUVTV_08365, partial [Anaerolineae bacterium]
PLASAHAYPGDSYAYPRPTDEYAHTDRYADTDTHRAVADTDKYADTDTHRAVADTDKYADACPHGAAATPTPSATATSPADGHTGGNGWACFHPFSCPAPGAANPDTPGDPPGRMADARHRWSLRLDVGRGWPGGGRSGIGAGPALRLA